MQNRKALRLQRQAWSRPDPLTQAPPRFHVVAHDGEQWHAEDSFHTEAEAKKYIKNSKFWDGTPRRIVDALDRAAITKESRGRVGATAGETVHEYAPRKPRTRVVRLPLTELEHGESAMPGGKLTWPSARELVREYAARDTPLPPIEAIPPEHPGEKWMIEDGSHRYEAAKLRGDKTIDVVVRDEPPKVEVGEVRQRGTGERGQGMYDPWSGRTMLDRETMKTLSREQRAELVRHELAHKIETEGEHWKDTDTALWKLWEQDRRHPLWDYMAERTGRSKFDNTQSAEILADLYANDYPKGTFTVQDRPVPYAHEAGQTGPREYPIPPDLMRVLDRIEASLGIWGKRKARATRER